MSSEESVRCAVALQQLCKGRRTAKGGVAPKRKAERFLGKALETIKAEGYVSDESRENVLQALASFSEFLDLIR